MNAEDQEFLESLRKDFIDETFDLLLKCEESLLNFEKNYDEKFFQEYMRTLHSIKGSARAVEFDAFASTLHLIEGLGLKSKDQQFVEISLASLDGIKESLESARSGSMNEMDLKLASLTTRLSK